MFAEKFIKFCSFFIPSFWMVGGFILVVNGLEISNKFEGFEKFLFQVGILFLILGIFGKWFQDLSYEEEMLKKLKGGKQNGKTKK